MQDFTSYALVDHSRPIKLPQERVRVGHTERAILKGPQQEAAPPAGRLYAARAAWRVRPAVAAEWRGHGSKERPAAAQVPCPLGSQCGSVRMQGSAPTGRDGLGLLRRVANPSSSRS